MNVLSGSRRRLVLNLLLEGCSIRATERLTGTHRDTIMRLLVDTGAYCEGLLDNFLANLPCRVIEADEIWTFVQKKQNRLSVAELADRTMGDAYLFVGFDPFSKLIAAHVVGKRDAETTTGFLDQLRRRIPGRIQLFTDGFQEYLAAVDGLYGTAIDYAQVIKPVKAQPGETKGHVETIVWCGTPALETIGTSYVERNNGTIRQQLRRFTRKTVRFLEAATQSACGGRDLRALVQLREAARFAARDDARDGARDRRHVLGPRPSPPPKLGHHQHPLGMQVAFVQGVDEVQEVMSPKPSPG